MIRQKQPKRGKQPASKKKGAKGTRSLKNLTYPEYPSAESKPWIERPAEVLEITDEGFWIRGIDKNYFISFELFPWFRYAHAVDIHDVVLHSVFLGKKHGGWVHGFHWNNLSLVVNFETLELLLDGGWVRPRQKLITHDYRISKIEDRQRDPNDEKKAFKVSTNFTFQGSFIVTADNEEEAKRIVEEQCTLCCGGVWIDIMAAPIDLVKWDYRDRPQKEIKEVVETTRPDFEDLY